MATEVELIKVTTETVLSIGEVSIDNFTFKLFYKWSVSLFIAGSVLVFSSQFFGDPIKCEIVSQDSCWKYSHTIHICLQARDNDFQTDDSADEDVVNNYCWMFSTLNIPPEFKVSMFLGQFTITLLLL